MRWFLSLAAVSLVLLGLAAAPAAAAPITYNFTGGTITVSAETTSGATVLAATQVALDGVFVTFDSATIDLVDFKFTVPTTGVLSLSGAYGPYDQFVIESAMLQPGSPYSTVSGMDLGGGSYSFAAGFVDIDGVYSASHTSGSPLPISNVSVPFTDDSFISGFINVTTGDLQLTGITLAILPGSLFSETEDLIVKADIVFTGALPEPGTTVFLGAGLVAAAAYRRNRTPTRH